MDGNRGGQESEGGRRAEGHAPRSAATQIAFGDAMIRGFDHVAERAGGDARCAADTSIGAVPNRSIAVALQCTGWTRGQASGIVALQTGDGGALVVAAPEHVNPGRAGHALCPVGESARQFTLAARDALLDINAQATTHRAIPNAPMAAMVAAVDARLQASQVSK